MSNDLSEIKALLQKQLPPSVLKSEPEMIIDGDELLVILHAGADVIPGEGEAREQGENELVGHLRSETRTLRVRLARSINHNYGLVVSWGMQVGETRQLFTNNSTIPVMTRLSREEREVLDTLIAANIANTRSTALSYIVRTFAAEHSDWLGEVQEVSKHMARLREQVQLTDGEVPGGHRYSRGRRIYRR